MSCTVIFAHVNENGMVWYGIAWFNVPRDTFLGHFGDSGVNAASASITAMESESLF